MSGHSVVIHGHSVVLLLGDDGINNPFATDVGFYPAIGEGDL